MKMDNDPNATNEREPERQVPGAPARDHQSLLDRLRATPRLDRAEDRREQQEGSDVGLPGKPVSGQPSAETPGDQSGQEADVEDHRPPLATTAAALGPAVSTQTPSGVLVGEPRNAAPVKSRGSDGQLSAESSRAEADVPASTTRAFEDDQPHSSRASATSEEPPADRSGQQNDVPSSPETSPEHNSKGMAPPPQDRKQAASPAQANSATPADVRAVHQTALLQRAWLNYGEMIGQKYVFEQTLDYHAPIPSEYLAVVREVYAAPHPNGISERSVRDLVADSTTTSRFTSTSLSYHQEAAFTQAVDRLRPAGAVLVLNRPPNTGRTITAHALLGRLLDEAVISEVRPVPFGGSQHFPAKRLPHDRNRGYVLELPPDEDGFEIAKTFGAGLRTVAEVLLRRDSRLVVLTSPEQWSRISQGAPEDIAPNLGESHPSEIAARWLRAQAPELPVEQWLNHHKIRALLVGQSPTDVLSLVDLILEEHRDVQRSASASPSGLDALDNQRGDKKRTLEEQVDRVVAARSNWEDKLYEWHEEQATRTSFQRNFLLAAAVLRGGSIGHVYAKAADLTKQLDGQEVNVKGQQAPGAIAMTRAIEARRTENETLAFERPHWDDAILEYFWNDRPLARADFMQWLARTPMDNGESKAALESFTRDERRALAGRIGEFAVRWAVRHRRQEPLQEIVKAWYEHGKGRELWPLAVDLLDGAACHAASAPYVHAMLLNWASRRHAALQLAVVAVCKGEFGRRHTGKALRRLRHVAEIGLPEVVESLQEAVRVLYHDPTVRPTLFRYVTAEWCRAEEIRDTVGLRTFAALASFAGPGADGIPLLLDDSDTEEAESGADRFRPTIVGLVTGWRTLLNQGAGPTGEREVDKAVFMWLDTAQKRSDLKPLVLQTLRKAADISGSEGPQLREALRTSAAGWVQGQDRPYDESREAVRRELGKLLDDDLLRRRHSEKDEQGPPEKASRDQFEKHATSGSQSSLTETGDDVA